MKYIKKFENVQEDDRKIVKTMRMLEDIQYSIQGLLEEDPKELVDNFEITEEDQKILEKAEQVARNLEVKYSDETHGIGFMGKKKY